MSKKEKVIIFIVCILLFSVVVHSMFITDNLRDELQYRLNFWCTKDKKPECVTYQTVEKLLEEKGIIHEM